MGTTQAYSARVYVHASSDLSHECRLYCYLGLVTSDDLFRRRFVSLRALSPSRFLSLNEHISVCVS